MLFSSPEFLFAFLPVFLAVYYFLPARFRNGFLLCASLFFYFAAAGALAVILVLSIGVNYTCGLQMEKASAKGRRAWLMAGIIINLAPLVYYKYTGFFLHALGGSALMPAMTSGFVAPALPVGISFFTFQSLSYLADIYTRRSKPAKSLINFGMYHSCFPQLIAGPIVRYEEIARQIKSRKILWPDVGYGSIRFCLGLGKKVVLADNMGTIANYAFGLKSDLDPLTAWIGIVAYTLQILFDFSGYSDMAIGLGRMLGFSYPENFNRPYLAQTVTDFWRRWHMTLTRWFRDYVYIPLGGNRKGAARTLGNLFLVFLLCGLWHGAAYTFIVWGLYHGFLLVIERFFRNRFIASPLPPILGHIYTLLAVMLGWVFFRAADLPQAGRYMRALFDIGHLRLTQNVVTIMTNDKIAYLIIAAAIALMPSLKINAISQNRTLFLKQAGATLVLALSLVMLSSNGFSPFIYFRF